MIRVRLTVDSGLLLSLEAEGHARTGAEKDASICAAVSLLCRSSSQALKDLNDLEIDGSAPRPGVLCFYVRYGDGAPLDRARGVLDTLIRGLEAATRENPRLCRFEVSEGCLKTHHDVQRENSKE
ncbi:ribosomal-processing cysteine protease Prp [Marispirochaeta aestuarii]|uniref:ribosomal-processing cysteine protease Prp n=1 Tax=Marispirochaeta aestuarii TaxID=1963862 RepID=UPI0029C93731|nr:ribosomal-processing cysteine protease Prp [Marispirochaeta aestuarii]